MVKVSTLKRAILRAVEGAEIYAQPPFTAESKALVIEFDGYGFLPEGFKENAERRGFELFLDSDTVNELLDAVHDVQINKDQLVNLVLYFADCREYPTWFHDLEVKG